MTKGRDYKLAPHLNGESCNEEEEYRLIFEEGEEAPNSGQDYEIPRTSCTYPTTNVRPKSVLKCSFVNDSNNNSRYSSQGVTTGGTFNATIKIHVQLY